MDDEGLVTVSGGAWDTLRAAGAAIVYESGGWVYTLALDIQDRTSGGSFPTPEDALAAALAILIHRAQYH